jgi:putative hydrolase of the HAD superfamily
MPYRAILFDLFGTLVHFKRQLPVPRPGRSSPDGWLDWLQAGVARDLPGVPFERFVEALAAVTEEIARTRRPEFIEVSSPERFRRALERLAVGGDVIGTAARLSQIHMAYLASETELPLGHRELLQEIGSEYRLALISNFDHAPTAERILRQHGLRNHFTATLISDGFGRRKPHAAIFQAALDALGVEASEALHVGDTLGDDVAGARAAGIDVAWIDRKGEGLPPGGEAPTFVLGRLADLRVVLRGSR